MNIKIDDLIINAKVSVIVRINANKSGIGMKYQLESILILRRLIQLLSGKGKN